ncbi:hypothetical protein ACCO45_010717 [Purpureocillium lilacinum]|uniref:Uncharacterized protein n=1 Tax=Purpureocillium lilacinum TaxID=33203 RepID=A0ACC4DHX5_PURLI
MAEIPAAHKNAATRRNDVPTERGRRRLRSKYRFVRAATRVRRAAIRRRSEPLTATAGLDMISELYEMLQASLELGLV